MRFSTHETMVQPTAKLTTPEFFATNDDLARRYKEASPSAKQNIIAQLYKLDIPLFQAWRILGDDRDDYKQEAYFWLERCLTTYKPDKGPFVNWLRWYVRKTFEDHLDKNPATPTSELTEQTSSQEPQEPIDSLFWNHAKQIVTPEQWDLIQLRFHHGLSIEEIARQKKTYAAKIRAPLHDALTKIKASSFSNQHDSTKKISTLDQTESRWLKKKDLAERLAIPLLHLKNLLDQNRDPHACPYFIHPADILRIPSVRIRFLETQNALVYPRFIRRGTLPRNDAGRNGLA